MSKFTKFVTLPIALVAALIFFMDKAHSANVIAIGDSLTAQPDSWHSYLPEHFFMIDAQNGRTVRDLDLSGDMKANNCVHTVVYMLGANDIFQKTNLTVFTDMARSHLRFLKDRGYDIVVVLPPVFSFKANRSDQVRWILAVLASELELSTADLDPIWDETQTSDGVHPVPPLTGTIAWTIDQALAN